MVAGARDRALASSGGQCVRGIHDNMRAAVVRVLPGREGRINPRFGRMCSHHLVEPTFCNLGAAGGKGRVEKQIRTMRGLPFKPRLEAETMDERGAVPAERCRRHVLRHRHPDFPEQQVHEVSAGEEQRCLVPGTEPAHSHASRQATASRTCLVRFAGNSYSVEARAAGRPVELRAMADRACLRPGGETAFGHARGFGRGQAVQSHPHHPHTGAQARGDPRVARRSGPGICRPRRRRCGSAWRQAGMAASRWCAFSPVHGITVSRRSPPPVPRRWRPASAMPTSSSTSPPGAAGPDRCRRFRYRRGRSPAIRRPPIPHAMTGCLPGGRTDEAK